MELQLISKKDLLELTGISYGQLYRWKRKNLIPEDWFIRKSTFTGQETFFPKDKILARIDKIMNMKEDLSLDELADVFSPYLAEASIDKNELLDRNIVSKVALDFYIAQQGEPDVFTFDKLLFVSIFDKLLQTGEISLDEGKHLLGTLAAHYPKYEGKSCELIMLRKMGVSAFMLLSSPNEAYFEIGVKVVVRLNVSSCLEELKTKLS